MRNSFIIVLILMMLNINSCVHVDGYSNAQQILISKESFRNIPVDIRLIEGTSLDKTNYYELNFEKVKEGGSYLFGKRITGVIADDYPRLEIRRNGEIVAKYSINEIKRMNYQIVSDSVKIYKIPELE